MELHTPPEEGKESPQLRNAVAIKAPRVCRRFLEYINTMFGHVNMNEGVILGIQVLWDTGGHHSIICQNLSTSSWSSSFTPLCVVKSRGSSHSGWAWP